MPLLRASRETPREKVVRSSVEVRYSFRVDMRGIVHVIEEVPRIRTILFRYGYRDGFDGKGVPRPKLKTFRIELPWTYFLCTTGSCGIVFTDHRVRSIDEPACHAAPLPNTTSDVDGNVNICLGHGVRGGLNSTIESYKRFWASIFNEELPPDGVLIPDELEPKSEYWADALVKWQSLTRRGKAGRILWCPLWTHIDMDGESHKRLHSLRSIASRIGG